MTTVVRVEHPDGTTETLTHITSTIVKEFNKQDVLSVVVPRPQSKGLTTDEDEVYLTKNFTDGVIDDAFGTFDTATWTVSGDASYDSTNGRVQLNTATANVDGKLQYDSGISDTYWECDFDFTIGSGSTTVSGVVALNFFADIPTTTLTDNGYAVKFDHTNDAIELVEVSGGTETVLASNAVTIGDAAGTTHTATVHYKAGKVLVRMDGTQYITHTIASPTTANTGFFFEGFTGTNYAAHYTDNIVVHTGQRLYGGILSDMNKGGVETELNVDSFERYAREAKPSGALYTFENVADTTIVEDAIDSVNELMQGTIATIKSGLTFEFNHTTPARRIRTVRDATGGELVYHPDKSVDYVSSVGTDKSASITISPSNQNIVENFSVEQNSGSKRANHIRMLGGGSGDAQTVVEVTASSYDATTDREVWTTYANKEIKDSATLREQATELVEELSKDHLEISATITDEDIAIGDTLHVKYDAEGINHNLRVVELSEIRSQSGLTYDVKLSNRNLSRFKNAEKIAQDVERFNRAQAQETLSTYDDPSTAPQEEGKTIYVTGANSNYERGIYYHNGSNYEAVQYADVDAQHVYASDSFVAPVGVDKSGLMVLPTGIDKYETT